MRDTENVVVTLAVGNIRDDGTYQVVIICREKKAAAHDMSVACAGDL
jgi:hypothetical protein